eukprot:maker-scaffold_16-snap-gene-5.12-mRNA-1 protein AED:0.29 eAED:0.29 QI:46/1/0.75/1/1/1/4/28/324
MPEEIIRGRARSRSFHDENQEKIQRGVVDTKESSISSPNSNKQKEHQQFRDGTQLSKRTLDIVNNISPAETKKEKNEADIAEEELERNMLNKGFLTPTTYDYYIKILLLGNLLCFPNRTGSSGVGKTSLLLRFTEDKFQETLIGTAGVDFKLRYLDTNGKRTKCQVWDTAGQERFHVITRSYYTGAHGIALVYDASDRNTFKTIQYWLDNIKKYANKDVKLMLLANKNDLPNPEVKPEEGKEVAEKNGYKFFQTSAKTGSNVIEAFQDLSNQAVSVLQRKEKEKRDSPGAANSQNKPGAHPLAGHQKNILDATKQKQYGCCQIS